MSTTCDEAEKKKKVEDHQPETNYKFIEHLALFFAKEMI